MGFHTKYVGINVIRIIYNLDYNGGQYFNAYKLNLSRAANFLK